MNEVELGSERESRPIGEGTSLRVGLVIIIASYIAMSSWWASAINSKLTVVVAGQQGFNSDITELRGKVGNLERVSDRFENFGSPVLRTRIESIERTLEHLNTIGSPLAQENDKRLSKLERAFDLHVAKTTTATTTTPTP